MNRDYDTGTANTVSLFIGKEIEKTPAYGMQTLFVVGIQNVDKLKELAKNNNCNHIYLGANQSFNIENNNQIEAWEFMTMHLLKEDFWVTLDFDVKYCEVISDMGLCEHNRFIPQISVKIPYINLMNYNACVKIDDKDYNASNPGVWIHRLHDLKSLSTFTDWDQYKNDKIIDN